ncbi:unnamed protein product [Laminaria digitata]
MNSFIIIIQAITLLSREAAKVLPTLACLLLGTALALHVLYGEGSVLLEGTGYLGRCRGGGGGGGFRTFGVSCGTVLRAGLGDVRLAGDWDRDVPYGEPLYILLYLFAVVVAMGLVSILIGLLANQQAADPVRMGHKFHLARTRAILRSVELCERNALPSPLNLFQAGVTLGVWVGHSGRRPSEKRMVRLKCDR